jgi:hypothetical protein
MKRIRKDTGVYLVMMLAITGLLGTAASISWAATNLNTSRSNVYRIQGAQLVTATASLSGPEQTQTVYTTPETGEFVLTQLCVSPVNGGIRLAVTGFGQIAHTGDAMCTTFNPGMIVPKKSTMTCSTTTYADSGEYFCTISGLLAH